MKDYYLNEWGLKSIKRLKRHFRKEIKRHVLATIDEKVDEAIVELYGHAFNQDDFVTINFSLSMNGGVVLSKLGAVKK